MNVREIRFERQAITRIQGLSHLRFLRCLSLVSNKLARIDGIGDLHSLEELDLRNNRVEALPKSMKNLQALKVFKIDNNALTRVRSYYNHFVFVY